MENLFSPISGEDQKIRKMEHFFSPNSSAHLRSDAHHSQIIWGDADVDHTQTIGGDTVKLLRRIYPPHPPRVSAACLEDWKIKAVFVFHSSF